MSLTATHMDPARGQWLQDMKGSLSLTASIIATITFSLAVNPPGGVLQASTNDNSTCSYPYGYGVKLCMGEAVLAATKPEFYYVFLVLNTACFFASLSVCLLLVSGIPLNHRFLIWLSSIGMCITSIILALTYLFATFMVTPDFMWSFAAGNIGGVFSAFSALVVIFFLIRLCVRGVH